MKLKLNKLFIVLVLSFIAVLAIGCSGNNNQSANQDNEAAAATNEQVVIPEEEPALTGKVKAIAGNEITVYKAAAPEQAPGQPPTEAPDQQPAQAPEQPPAGEETPAEPDPGTAGQAAGQAPAPRNGEAGPGNRPPGLQVTEETATFVIPADTPIVTLQRGSNETTPVNLTEIKEGQFLRVWQKDDTVYFVQMMGGMGPGTDGPADTGNKESGADNAESAGGN